MRSRWKMAAAVLAAVAGAASVAGCTGDSGTGDRAPLALPAASAFKAGTCATIADPVLALGRFTYDKAGKKLSVDDRAAMVAEGEKLRVARDSAEKPIADQISALLMNIGFVRVRVGDTYDPKLLVDVETARTSLQSTCTTS